jgi:hypothetical protein
MDNFIKEGEQMLDGQGGNQQGQGNFNDNQQGGNDNRQQSDNSGSGSTMKNFEHNTEDAYINQGKNDLDITFSAG